MKKIAIIPGSYNPFHIGHLMLGEKVKGMGFDKILYLISPLNPYKKGSYLLDVSSRIGIMKNSLKGTDFEICDLELRLPKPNYTYLTMKALENEYKDTKFTIVLGSDTFNTLDKWKNFEYLKKFSYIALVRNGEEIKDIDVKVKRLVSDIEISSTTIRDNIKKSDYTGIVNKDAEFFIKYYELYEHE